MKLVGQSISAVHVAQTTDDPELPDDKSIRNLGQPICSFVAAAHERNGPSCLLANYYHRVQCLLVVLVLVLVLLWCCCVAGEYGIVLTLTQQTTHREGANMTN